MTARSIDPAALLEDLGWVRALARGLVRDEALAEDLVQETWLEAAERKWPGGRPPRAWLATVLRNLFRQEQRSGARRRRREGLVAAEEALPSTAELVERIELQRLLAEEVLRLEEPLRSTLVLRFAKGLEPKEIAGRQGIPASTVRSRSRRGLEILRERLDARSGGDRRRWLVGIVPIALEREGGLSTALLSTGTGGLVMKAVGLAGAAVVAVLLVVVMTNRGGEVPEESGALDGPELSTGSDGPGTRHPEHLSESSRVDATAANRRSGDATPVEHILRGRVVDEAGAPVAGEEVLVFAGEDAFGPDSDLPTVAEASLGVGRMLQTDLDGRFEVVFPERREVKLMIMPSAGYAATRKATELTRILDATTPADGLLFVLRSNPTARLEVRVYDATEGAYLDDFAVRVTGEELGYSTQRVTDTTQTMEFAMLRGTPEHGQVILVQPEYDPQPEFEFVLTPGGRTKVELVVQPKHQLFGRVTDLGGTPIEGALVYFGVLADGRGDEPFKPFRPKRITGERTDDDGRFRLSGDGEWVTVWHPNYLTTTVPAQGAFVIELHERGRLRGIWNGDVGAEVRLDKDRGARITAAGQFVFEHVDAGDHRLVLPDGTSVCVWLDPGEELEMDLTSRIENVSLTAVAFGEPYTEAWRGVLFGTGAISSLLEADSSGEPLELNDVLPGTYRAFTMDCRQGTALITGGSAVIDFGDCRLTVTTTPGRRLSLIPEGGGPMEQIFGRRLWTRVDDAGKLELAPLPAGRYSLRDLNSGVEAPVVVEGPRTELVLE